MPLLLLFLSIGSIGKAQTHAIRGNVVDDSNAAIAFANVLVLKSNDSTLVKGGITNDDGTFLLENIPSGSYFVKASLIGYQEANSNIFDLRADRQLDPLVLVEGEALDEVVVEAAKPLFQQKVDRMVINVASSIVSSGGTALEILERSPGVIVNRQSNSISLSGKDGVVVMINGKISYMPANALVQMLEGMPANNIETIELITTPPANFDAEGNAGYINIVLKKRTDLGLNGSYSFSFGYGKGFTNNDNISFNYRKNKINLFGSYSYSLDQRDQIFKASREFESEGNLLGTSTTTERDPSPRNHNARLGLDVEFSEKTIMGIILTGFDNKWTMDALNTSIDTENGVPTAFVTLDNTERNQLKHFGVNYNIKHNFTEDEFISLDANYLLYEFDNPTTYLNTFFDADMLFDREEQLRSGKETPITTLVGQIDYSNKFTEKLKFDTGFKITSSVFENDVIVEDLINGVWVTDPTLTNRSELDEVYYAAYTSFDYAIDKKTSLKAGLRYEFTDSKLDTDTEGTVVDREFGVWFPSVFLNRKFGEHLSMNLSYTKRITRPTFNDLAPFVIFFDPNTFLSGNAALQPSISNSFKYDINYRSYFLSFQYTDQENTIANFQEQIDEETGRLIFEAANLEYTRTFTTTLGFPFKITQWWRTQNNFSLFNQSNRGFYNGEPVEQSVTNISTNSTHSFKFNNSFSAELSGFYNGPNVFGTARYDGVLGVNFGVQYKFSDKWGTVKFAVNDILDSIEFTGGTNLPEQNIRTDNLFDFSNRTFLFTYSRNFGNSKLKSARQRGTSADEERRRVN